MEYDLARRRGKLDANGFDAAEFRGREIDVEREVVVFGNDRRRQALGLGGRARQQEKRTRQGRHRAEGHACQCNGISKGGLDPKPRRE
jgi:hypothetical protein